VQEQAWTAFLDAYSRLILYVARQTPGDYDAIMDRYAFVVERLRDQNYRRIRTYAADGRGKFTTWLMVVVRRLCLDQNRLKHGRAPSAGVGTAALPHRLIDLVFLDPEAIEQLEDHGPAIDKEFDRKQVLEQLEAAIQTLDPGDQVLLALRYQDDRSARDISSFLKLPTPFHVYRRLNRVLATLRQALIPLTRGEPGTGGEERDQTAVQYRVEP
jgi:RNA polymerase sigma factor (sigma-70 family)